MRTRASAHPAAAAPANGDRETDKAATTNLAQKPLKSLILPSNASDEARFVSLENPTTGKPNPYYFCPRLGLYEFTLIAPQSSAARSVLFTPSPESKVANGNGEEEKKSPPKDGYISKLAQLHVATPVDIIFFILPILAPSSKRNQTRKLFQPLDDILDAQEHLSKPLRNVLLQGTFRERVERRMTAVCDTVEAGETMFRLSEDKLLKELLSKAESMVANGLPASLEERFVRRELEPPLLNVSRENPSASNATESSPEDTAADGPDSQDTNESASTTTANASSTTPSNSTSTPATPATQHDSQDELAATDSVRQLLRIRTALSFILSSYIPEYYSTQVETALKSQSSPIDFTPLNEHLKHIAGLRAKAQESRAMYDLTRKRGIEDEDEAAEARAEKRLKEEEEKKKKAGESRGVRDLKKVNTSGMKKLSAFFGKPAKK